MKIYTLTALYSSAHEETSVHLSHEAAWGKCWEHAKEWGFGDEEIEGWRREFHKKNTFSLWDGKCEFFIAEHNISLASALAQSKNLKDAQPRATQEQAMMPKDIWATTAKILTIRVVMVGVQPMAIITLDEDFKGNRAQDGYDQIAILPKTWRVKRDFIQAAHDKGEKISICVEKKQGQDRQHWIATSIESCDEEEHCVICDTELVVSEETTCLYCPQCTADQLATYCLNCENLATCDQCGQCDDCCLADDCCDRDDNETDEDLDPFGGFWGEL